MISEPFELLQLPRVSQKAGPALSTAADHDSLFVGASGSSISKLALRPPQVLRTHALAPGVAVSALLAWRGALAAYASVERGKPLLHLLPPADPAPGSGSAGDSGSSVAPALAAKSGPVVELPAEAVALYMAADRSALAVLTRSADAPMLVYAADDLQELWRAPPAPHEELVFSSRLAPDAAAPDADTAVVAVWRARRTAALRAAVLAVDRRGVHALASAPLGLDHSPRMHFSLGDARLYVAAGADLRAFSVPQMAPIGTVPGQPGDPDIKGLQALPNHNLVVVRGTEVQQLDFSFGSVVSRRAVPAGLSALLDYVPGAGAVVAAQGGALVGLPVAATRGSLLESVGRGAARAGPAPRALTDIFAGFAAPAPQLRAVAARQLAEAQREVDAVVADLEGYIRTRDGPAFAAIVVYLKSPAPKRWAEVVAEARDGAAVEDLVYEESHDRNADARLVQRACELAFLPRFKPYLPIGVAGYLLTHPLFPLGQPAFAKVLRQLERSDAILYRQALVSLTGLPAPDLVRGLLTPDEATFLDAAVRLQEDYGPAQILHGIRTAFKSARSISALSVLVERLSRYPETIGLMAPFIDAMGLLAWDPAHIRQLHGQLAAHIDRLEAAVKASTAISDLFNTIGLDPSDSAAVSAGEAKQRSANYTTTIASNQRRVVPKYSIETLVL